VAELERPFDPSTTQTTPEPPAFAATSTAPFAVASIESALGDETPTHSAPLPNRAETADIASVPGIDTVRQAVVSALADAGHATAAQLLSAGVWSVDGSSLRIEVTGIGKKMLSLTVNGAAEKIIRQELQRHGAPSRFLIVPGEGSGAAAPAMVPIAGSIQETALANPLVQRARELFKAEVRSVIDLRTR
jgi:DNA polymerase III subunit gamma/tau